MRLEHAVAETDRRWLTPLFARLDEIYDDVENHALGIYGRRDVILGMDLTFHSIVQFVFQGVLVRRGWCECLVPGDAGTGKSTIARGMLKWYRAGEYRSAENVSIAGLIGGMEKVSDRLMMKWGILPRMDGRLLVLDEAHAMHEDVLGALTGVRSEGVAEVTKIQEFKANARVRLIWIANPVKGHKDIRSYGKGILVVPSVIQRSEDVRRFDMAIVAANDDVDPEYYRSRLGQRPNDPKYTSELCARMIRWAWSRRPSQVVFPDETTSTIMEESKRQSELYSDEIPLMLPAEAHVKYARMAAAMAVRLFSTETDSHETVLVRPEHVHAVSAFLDLIYAKPSSGFQRHSVPRLRNTDDVESRIRVYGKEFIRVLLEHEMIPKMLLMDLIPDKDEAADLYRFLLVKGCLRKRGKGNMKTGHFIDLLNKLEADPGVIEEMPGVRKPKSQYKGDKDD